MKMLFVCLAASLAAASMTQAVPPPKAAEQKRVGSDYLMNPRPDDPEAVRVFEAKLHQRFVAMPPPEYSFAARRWCLEGTGVYQLSVDARGKVTRIEVLKSAGYAELDDGAKNAFRHWYAKPGPPLVVRLPITFSLNAPVPQPSPDDQMYRNEHPIYTPVQQVAPSNR